MLEAATRDVDRVRQREEIDAYERIQGPREVGIDAGGGDASAQPEVVAQQHRQTARATFQAPDLGVESVDVGQMRHAGPGADAERRKEREAFYRYEFRKELVAAGKMDADDVRDLMQVVCRRPPFSTSTRNTSR